jgi:DNA-binding NtrC family response regulator
LTGIDTSLPGYVPLGSKQLVRLDVRIIAASNALLAREDPWPGNVRELRNVIRRAMLLASDVIEPDDLAFLSVGASPMVAVRGELAPGHSSLKEIAGAAAAEAEQQAIRRALEITMGNKSEAARLLRTDYKTLHLKMKHYGVDARRFRELHAAR